MKPTLFVFSTIVSVLALACGGATGDDVHVGDGQSASQQQAETCAIAPGEDVCRRFATLDPAVLATLGNAVAFAGLAERSVKAMEAACIGLGADLGAPIPTFAPSATLAERTTTACDVAANAIGARKAGGTTFSVQYDAAKNCYPLAMPSCASPTQPVEECAPEHVQVVLGSAATMEDHAFGAALEARLPAIFAYKEHLARLTELASTFSANIQTITELPAGCEVTVVHMLQEAVNQITAASRATSSVAGKL